MYGLRLIWSLVYEAYGKRLLSMLKTYQFSLSLENLNYTKKNSVKLNRNVQLTMTYKDFKQNLRFLNSIPKNENSRLLKKNLFFL